MATQGIALSGLQTNGFGQPTSKSVATIEAEIDAAKNNFGANTIRLQIQQQALVGDGTQYDATYHATVDTVAAYVLAQGLTLVLNCQSEPLNSGSRTGAYYPDQTNNATSTFWSYLGPTYNGNANVIFDLFNEPDGNPGGSGGNWSVWQASFNSLIANMRMLQGLTNVFWADADNYAASFSGCPGLTDPGPGAGLVYSFHHPPSAAGGNTAGWDTDFGNWASTHPVVNGEFAQNANFNWDSAYDIQAYLNYLTTKGIGQTLWTTFADGTNYFSDSARQPAGWWGHMIANKWSVTGYNTYVFRSSAAWQQNYKRSTGGQITFGDLYQGYSATYGTTLLGAAGFNSLTTRMAEGTQWRLHLAFNTIHANGSSVTAVVGVHDAATKPSNSSGLNALTNIVQLPGCIDGKSYTVDIPSGYLAAFAAGTHKGIVFGWGPNQDVVYQGHHGQTPQLVLEVHA